jgi:hypothetical protein
MNALDHRRQVTDGHRIVADIGGDDVAREFEEIARSIGRFLATHKTHPLLMG